MMYTAEQQRQIADALEHLRTGRRFKNATQPRKLLVYLVEQHLSGRSSPVDEQELAAKALEIRDFVKASDDARVRGPLNDVRDKLNKYRRNEGREAPVLFDVPEFGYELVVEFREPPAVPALAPQTSDGRAQPAGSVGRVPRFLDFVRERPLAMGGGLVLFLMVLLVALAWPRFFSEAEGFQHLGEAGVVRTDENVSGTGPESPLNRYLVVEPQTFSRERFIQTKLQTKRWSNVPAQFGERDTPDGTRFRVFVLVTSLELPVGKIIVPVADAMLFFETYVTLRK